MKNMTKTQLMGKFGELLAQYTSTLTSARYEEYAEKDLMEFMEKLTTAFRDAVNEIPTEGGWKYSVEAIFHKELELTVRAGIAPEEPMTRHYPGSPAHIEDMEILIEGCPITQTLYNKLTETYEDEIEQEVWDQAEAEAEDMAQAHAEHLMEAAEHRRDLMEGR